MKLKLEVLKKHLEDALHTISRISDKNLSLPVLGCIVITVSPSHTTLKATNLDVSAEINLKSKILSDGVVAIPAPIFSQVIMAHADEKITLESDDGTLKIIGSHGETKLKSVDPTDFPSLPYVKKGEGVSLLLPTKDLVRAFKGVSFASATTGIRPELSSVFLSISENTLIAAATDSFRLAEIKIPLKTKQAAHTPLLIPTRNIPDIIKIIDTADMVEIRASENQITCIADGNYITSRIVDGAFPEYGAIIPKSFTTSLTMLAGDVAGALKKVSVVADQTGQIELSVNGAEKKVFIKGINTNVGEVYESLDAVIDGDDVVMYFNARYILDALNVVGSDSVVFRFSGAGKPLIIGETPEKGFTYLVMPMNK